MYIIAGILSIKDVSILAELIPATLTMIRSPIGYSNPCNLSLQF